MSDCGSACKLVPKNTVKVTFKDEKDFIDFHGARISPKGLYMKNAYEGKQIHETVTIQNISTYRIHVRTLDPSSTNFTIIEPAHGEVLSSGLKYSFKVMCTYTAINKAHHCLIPIIIDEYMYSLPVAVSLSTGIIYSNPQIINFDRVNSTPCVNTKVMCLHNRGCKTSKFEIDQMASDLNIVVYPQRGIIPPNGVVKVSVEFVGIDEGILSKEIWVKCEKPFRVPVYANVIRPSLMVRGPTLGENFHIIRLTHIYGGCTSKSSFSFNNFNTLAAMFVVLPEIEHVVVSERDAELQGTYHKFVTIDPKGGPMRPDEEKTINISFSPKNVESIRKEKLYFIVFRIIRLDCTEVKVVEEVKTPEKDDFSIGLLKEQNSQMSVKTGVNKHKFIDDYDGKKMPIEESCKNPRATDFLRICLYGVVKPVKVTLTPEEFYFEPLPVNKKASKTIIIYNKSNYLPIHYQYRKTAFVELSPPSGYLKCRESLDLVLTLEPRAAGVHNITVTIDLLYPNQPVKDGIPKLVVVGSRTALVHFHSKLERHKLVPKFNMGITPLITNEVGIVGDGVKFNSKCHKPRAAIIDRPTTGGSNLIAFPNDRPKCLRPWTNVMTRTIFARIPRLVTLEDEYMLNPSERQAKDLQRQYYKELIRHNTGEIKKVDPCKDTLECNNMMEGLFRKTLALLQPEKISPQRRKVMSMTATEIYFVKVSPQYIDVGKIALASTTVAKLRIINNNNFCVTIMLVVNKSGSLIFKKLPQNVVVPAYEEIIFDLEVLGCTLGRYSTIINVVINQQFSIPVAFTMLVARLSVKLDQSEISVQSQEAYMSRQVNVSNSMNVPVGFTWSCPVGSCFMVEPSTGTIPRRRSITCTIFYLPDMVSRTSSKLTITCESGAIQTLLAVVEQLECADAELIEKNVHFPYLPLNMLQQKTNILINYGYEPVLFQVRNPNPFPGVVIEPVTGRIEKRSFQILYVSVHIKALIEFRCVVEIECHNNHDLSFTVSGNVEFPSIQYIPQEIHMKKIVAGGIDVHPFKLQNVSNAKIQLTFLKECFPEVKISTNLSLSPFEDKNEIFLEPGEQIQLFLKFLPLDVCLNQLYLPIMLNDMLGPAFFGSTETMQVETYLQSYWDLYSEEEDVKLNHCVRNLPVLLLHVVAYKPILQISNLFVKFKYLSNKKSITVKEITITNMREGPTEFCIRTDDVEPNFQIKYFENANVECLEKALSFNMEQSEVIKLQFQFIPSTYGTYEAELPIFIKNYNNCNIFNYIQLVGIYSAPILESVNEINLEPMMVGIMLERRFSIQATFHEDGCSLISKIDILQIQVEEAKYGRKKKSKISTEITMVLTFVSESPMSFQSELIIYCSCGAQCKLKITGCADTCFLTYHAMPYLTAPKDSSGEVVLKKHGSVYPKQPDSEDLEFSKYMSDIIVVLEKWIHEQMLCGDIHCTIPKGVNRPIQNYLRVQPPKKLNAKPEAPKILKESLCISRILVTLLDEDAPECIVRGVLPNDHFQRVKALHTLYTNILILLETYGAFLPHVQPRYLLMYRDYELYMTKVKCEEYYTGSEFYRYSTQCWVDVFLQIIKCLVLAGVFRTRTLVSEDQSALSLVKSNCMFNFSETNTIDYVDSETTLLNWLSIHYNKEIRNLRMLDDIEYTDFEMENRQFQNFNVDMSDGLAFIAVIIAHCPYLTKYFKKIFVNVNSKEKAFHNAARIIFVLNQIYSSFKLKPSQIVYPCTIQMILFACYLHGVLPHLNPKSTIEFKAELGGRTENEIIISNPNQRAQHFNAVLLFNERDCFSLERQNLIKVQPNRSTKVKVFFQAKKVDRVSATIIFCGDTPGQFYSKSLVFNLVGIPLFNQESQKICVTMPLFTMKEKRIKIKSPYKGKAEYQIWFTHKPPNSDEVLTLYSLKELLAYKSPRFSCFYSHTVPTDEKGEGVLTTILCCTKSMQQVYGFFVNETIGDFFIKLIVQSGPHIKSKVEWMPLHVDVPFFWPNTRCTCASVTHVSEEKCPRWLKIKVPSRNELYWRCVVDMFLLQVSDEYVNTWRKVLESDVGPFLTKWLTIDNKSITSEMVLHLLNECITYTVNTTNTDFDIPETLKIDNVFSTEATSMFIHVADKAACPLKPLDFTMLSENLLESRFYRVFFHLGTPDLT